MATITLGLTSAPATVSRTYNGTDQDAQDLLDWAASSYAQWIAAQYNPTGATGFTPTNAQIASAIAYDFIDHLKAAVQTFKTTPPSAAVVPPPMSWT